MYIIAFAYKYYTILYNIIHIICKQARAQGESKQAVPLARSKHIEHALKTSLVSSMFPIGMSSIPMHLVCRLFPCTWYSSINLVCRLFPCIVYETVPGIVYVRIGPVKSCLLVNTSGRGPKSHSRVWPLDKSNMFLKLYSSTDRCTVSFHDFESRNFKLRVSNPKSKYVAYLSVLSQISNCQGLGRKNKFEISKTDRTTLSVLDS